MTERFELQVWTKGAWATVDTYEDRATLDRTLELFKGCVTNDGEPRKYRVWRWVIEDDPMMEGTF